MSYLIDAHHLGARQTGNETWVRNICDELSQLVPPGGLTICVTEARVAVPKGVRALAISGRAVRRLTVDLPRAAKSCDAAAMLVQYTMPLTRRPCVVMIHDLASFEPEAAQWLGRPHARRIRVSIEHSARHARVLLTPSRYTRDLLLDRYGLDPAAVLIAPNAVDPELAQSLDSLEASTDRQAARIIAVGNVLPRKNLGVVGRAIAILRSQGVAAELRVVGQVGHHGESICHDLRRRLDDAVSFTGYVTTKQLAMEYRNADVLVFPSLYEGFGIPALEAMYAGLPVVVSSAASLPEVVGEDGLVVPPDDAEQWAEAIHRVLPGEELADDLVARGRRRAEAASWRASAAVVLNALETAASAELGNGARTPRRHGQPPTSEL